MPNLILKKICSALLVAVIINFLAKGQSFSPAPSWKEVKGNKKGTMVCLWNHGYGLVYKADDGHLKGVAVDILKDFKSYVSTKYKTQLDFQFVEETSFSNFLKSVSDQPNVIGVSSVSITEDRKKFLQFSPPYLSNPNVIITHRSANNLTRIDEIAQLYKGCTLKVVEGSVHDQYAKRIRSQYFSDLTIQYASSSKLIFEEMEHDKKVFTIIDFGEFLGAYKDNKNLVRQNVELDLVDKMGFVFSKQSDWAAVWQEFLTDEYRSSTRYKQIISGNLGSAYLSMINKIEKK